MVPCPECGETAGHNRIGYQIDGVYDGVLYWGCFTCGALWPRDFGDWDRLNQASRLAVEEARQVERE